MSDENISAQLEDRLSEAIEAASKNIRKTVRVKYMRGIARDLIYTDEDTDGEEEGEEETEENT
jgi:CRP-like cAMP-binding protein